MNLKEFMAQDAAVFLNANEMGSTVFYNGAEITAIVELEADREDGNTFVNDGQSARAIIHIARADVPSPKQGDKVVFYNQSNSQDYIVGDDSDPIGSDEDPASLLFKELFGGYEWEVARILHTDGAMHELECIANESPW